MTTLRTYDDINIYEPDSIGLEKIKELDHYGLVELLLRLVSIEGIMDYMEYWFGPRLERASLSKIALFLSHYSELVTILVREVRLGDAKSDKKRKDEGWKEYHNLLGEQDEFSFDMYEFIKLANTVGDGSIREKSIKLREKWYDSNRLESNSWKQ